MPIEFNTNTPGIERPSIIDTKKISDSHTGLVQGLNEAITKSFGLDSVYFRTIPNQNAEDVIFMNYTLLNVEDCPTQVKVVLKNSAYAMGDYTIQLYQMNYNIPLEVEVDIQTWLKAYGSGTMPQRYDILYIPYLHKIFEVDSVVQNFSFMEMLTGYTMVLKKYNPKEFRRETESLATTLDTYTTSIAELFGESLTQEVQDMVNDHQSNPYNTSPFDGYKYFDERQIKIISENGFNFYSTNYEVFDDNKGFVLEYKHGEDFDLNQYAKYVSLFFRHPTHENKFKKNKFEVCGFDVDQKKILSTELGNIPVVSVRVDFSNDINHLNPKFYDPIEVYTDTRADKKGYVYFNHYNKKDKSLYLFMRYVDYITWVSLDKNFFNNKLTLILKNNKEGFNILSSYVEDEKGQRLSHKNFSVSFTSERTLDIWFGGVNYVLNMNKPIEDNLWYGFGMYIDEKKIKVNVFETNNVGVNTKLKLYDSVEVLSEYNPPRLQYLVPEEPLHIERYGIEGTHLNIGQIRMYNLPKRDLSKEKDFVTTNEMKADLTSNIAFNDSYCVINDECTIKGNTNSFVSKHK